MTRERWAISIGEDRFLGVGWFSWMSSRLILAGKNAGQLVVPVALFGTRREARAELANRRVLKSFKGAKPVKVTVTIEAAGGSR